MYLVAFLLCAIAFSLTPEAENQRLKQTNRALLNALKEMNVGDAGCADTMTQLGATCATAKGWFAPNHCDYDYFMNDGPCKCMCPDGKTEESVGASNGATCSRDAHSSCSSGYCKTIAGNYGRRTYECAAKLSNGARCPSNHNACLSGNCLRNRGRNTCSPQAEVQAVAGETDVSQLHGVKYVEPQADNVCSEGSSWSSALQRCVSTTDKDCGLCISTCTAMPRYSGSDCRAMCARDCQGSEVSVGLTKSDLIESIAAKTRLSGKEVEDAVADILSNMSSALEAGDRIEIRGFGSFSSLYQATKKSGNPKPGYQPARGKYVPSFNPAEDLRERVNNGNVETAVFWTNLNLNRQAKAIVELFFEEIGMALESGESVHLSGFGNFELYEKNERPGRNPKTGEDEPITARTAVTFLPGPRLKALVANIEL